MKKKVFIVLGPTSSGKTSLSIDLCKRFNGEIISADSRQVVKYMDIGTGKIPVKYNFPIEKDDNKWLIDGVTVSGYDLTEPDKYFSGVDWAEFALTKAKNLLGQGKSTFLVGGTGFYIDLFTAGVKPNKTKPNLLLRKELNELSLKQLQKRLTTLSPTRYKNIDKNNSVRLIRAIESEMGTKKNDTPLPYLNDIEFIFIGLTSSRQTLYSRVDMWTDEIWNNGLINEVKKLNEMGFSKSRKLQGLVYKQAQEFLSEEISKEEAIQKTKFSLHAYIRRQQTYFKKMPNIIWFDITHDDYKEKIYTLVNG